MIEIIDLENIEILSNVISSYLHYIKEKMGRPVYPLKKQLKKGLKNKIMELYTLIDENNNPLGFSVTNTKENRISLIFDKQLESTLGKKRLAKYERELFIFTFNQLKKKADCIRMGGEVSESLNASITELNFGQYDRLRMMIDRTTIEQLTEILLSSEYVFTSWNGINENNDYLIRLMAETHFNAEKHPDGLIFSRFAGIEGCQRLVREVEESVYGEYDSNYSRILKHNDKSIGVCFLTKYSNKRFGYIPEIFLLPKYQGKGLGKVILVHTIKYFIENEPDFAQVELDVTLSNDTAANLYKSVGFKETNKYSVYIWQKTPMYY
ncbi:MAG: GNAT family N-acetyltransferase [Candidatus Hodarchaeales archaeon]|jgi:ribosomal protein S18 acetylase RimI-like enzyme